MKYVFASLLSLLISLSSFSQKGKEYFLVDSVNYDSLPPQDRAILDSLLPLYHSAPQDTTRLKILVTLAENLSTESLWPRYNDLLYQTAELLLKNTNGMNPRVIRSLKKSYAMSLQDKGFAAEGFAGNITAALDYYYRCKRIQEEIGDKKGLSSTINNIGIALHSQGNMSKALEYYMLSEKIQEELHDTIGIAYSLSNIGASYIEQGDTAKAVEYQLKSIKLREGMDDKRGLAISMSNLAFIYINSAKPENGILYFNKCIKLWEEVGEKQGLAFCLRNMGLFYQRMAAKLLSEGKPIPDTLMPKAEDLMFRSLYLYESVGDKSGASIDLTMIGNHFLFQKNIPKAFEYGQRALAISRELGFPLNIKNSSLLMYNIYKLQGKWAEALAMHELSMQMRDSILNTETKKSTLQKQMKYEYDKQQAVKDAEHQKELVLSGEAKKRQQIVSYVTGMGLLMLILFTVFIFNRLRITRKQKAIIEQQKKIVDQKNLHITDSINYAKRIQDAILPSDEEMKRCFSDFFVLFRPKEIVSGDFYWLSHQKDKTILAVADCTGDGVPGAFMSMIGNTLLNEIVNEKQITDPAEILGLLNDGIVKALHQNSPGSQDDGMDISICSIDKATGKMWFAGAGLSCLVASGEKLDELAGDNFSPGGTLGTKDFTFTLRTADIGKQTNVYLFTDGFSDQPNSLKNNRFQKKNLQALLHSVHEKPMQEQKNILLRTISEWQGTRSQLDDMLVIGIRI